MKKKKLNDEIDLRDIFALIWKKKVKVVSITVIIFSIILLLTDQESPQKDIFVTETKVKPISTFDLIDYQPYNRFIETHLNYLKFEGSNYGFKENSLFEESLNKLSQSYNAFKIIDNKYLFKLFIDQILNKKLIIEIIKKENFIDKDEFDDENKYNDLVLNFVSSINFSEVDKKSKLIDNEFKIEVVTENILEWKKVLNELEKKLNDRVRLYLIKNFKKLINSEKKIMKYKKEDILLEKSNNSSNEKYVEFLDKTLAKLEMAKHLERLEDFFNEIEVLKSNNFKAATIEVDEMKLIKLNNNTSSMSLQMKILMSIITSFILSLIYIFFENIILRRK